MEELNFTNKVANVLGVDYTIKFQTIEENKQLEGLDGYCDPTIKLIVIEKVIPDIHTVKNLSVCYNKILLHELIHAFIYESATGHEDWNEENLCCYMSVMLPKINEAYNKIKF